MAASAQKRRRQIVLWASVLGLLLLSVPVHAQTITISVASNGAGVTLAGSGTGSTGFNAGTVSRRGGSLPIGLTRSTAASDWTLTSPFEVTVTKDVALTSASYTMQAQLSTADSLRIWKIDSVTLNSLSALTLTVGGTYGAAAVHSFGVTIPDNDASGAFSNTFSITAISN